MESKRWIEAMGYIHNLEANSHILGMMHSEKHKDASDFREQILKDFKRPLMDTVSAYDAELQDVQLMYDQLCIECRELLKLEFNTDDFQHRVAQVRNHIRRYEERKK